MTMRAALRTSVETTSMTRWSFRILLMLATAMLAPPGTWAAHPLVTDDAGTQGKGRAQFELNSEFGSDRSGATHTEELVAQGILSLGLSDSLDAVFGLPYLHRTTRENGTTARDNGVSDAAIELKWRFWEAGPQSFALKPSLTLPSGDAARGFGGGEPTYGMYLIASREIGSWSWHANAGYIRNDNDLGEELHHWHASLAAGAAIGKKVQAVVNAVFNHDHDPAGAAPLSAVLGGFIVTVSDGLDLDAGIRVGTSRPETDYAILTGFAWRI